MAYGSRVQRRLRGRWFSLVPVKRRALILWCVAVGLLVALLCAAHHASVTWPSIAYRPEIARALRLDRPDSFGRWVTSTLLAGCSGVSLLIYQLRRHKNDDYRGHYRLWRLVLVVMMLASVDSVASVVDWVGALLDAGFGKRVALSGNDWLRIVLSIGGAVLALRMSVEVRRSKFALAMMLIAWSVLAFPIAARWNFFTVDTIARWTIVTAAPLLASAILFVALGGYLRLLYREVRNITDDRTIGQRISQLKLRIFAAADEEDVSEPVVRKQAPVVAEESVKRGWLGRRSEKNNDHQPIPLPKSVVTQKSADSSDNNQQADPGEKRGWFGLRKPAASSPGREDKKEGKPASPAQEQTKRSRFSLRLKPAADPAAKTENNSEEPDFQAIGESETDEAKPKKRFGLGGWMNRGKDKGDGTSQDAEGLHRADSNSDDAEFNDEDIEMDGIDWGSMSKTERRRLRKKLKRDGRAA